MFSGIVAERGRLSADPAHRVCLIEAGPEDRSLLIHIPAGILGTLPRRQVNCAFTTEPQPGLGGRSRDEFFIALRYEGIPASGAFYEPVYRDKLFAWRDMHTGVDYSNASCPVAERAAYEQSVWLPHQVFLGPREDVDDIVRAIEKVTAAFRSP